MVVVIRTARLVLRPWTIDDAPTALSIYCSDVVSNWLAPWIGHVADPVEMRSAIQSWLTHDAYTAEPVGHWALERCEDSTLIDRLALMRVPRRGGPCKRVDPTRHLQRHHGVTSPKESSEIGPDLFLFDRCQSPSASVAMVMAFLERRARNSPVQTAMSHGCHETSGYTVKLDMKIVIAGGAGRIGSHITRELDDQGYGVVVASPRHGIDALTGHGLAEAFSNADMVIDTMNLPAAIPYSAAEEFFSTATTNLLRAGDAAGVRHHLLLSVVGVDRVNSDYFRGKRKQERLVREHGGPFSIVRSTSVLEALRGSVLTDPELGAPRVPNLSLQPVAADDLARVIAHTIAAAPRGGLIEVAGPEILLLPELTTRMMRATGDLRRVVVDHAAEYLGTVFEPDDTALLSDLRIGATSLDEWLVQPSA